MPDKLAIVISIRGIAAAALVPFNPIVATAFQDVSGAVRGMTAPTAASG
jgi:hypothetical protein